MAAPDVVQLFEGSYRLAGGSSLFAIDAVEPATFADQRGFKFNYTFTVEGEEVKRLGEAAGAIVGGKLYMITYEAPAIHYYDRNLGLPLPRRQCAATGAKREGHIAVQFKGNSPSSERPALGYEGGPIRYR